MEFCSYAVRLKAPEHCNDSPSAVAVSLQGVSEMKIETGECMLCKSSRTSIARNCNADQVKLNIPVSLWQVPMVLRLSFYL